MLVKHPACLNSQILTTLPRPQVLTLKVPLCVLLNALLEKAINHFLLGSLKRTENNGYGMKPRTKFTLTRNSHTFISMTNLILQFHPLQTPPGIPQGVLSSWEHQELCAGRLAPRNLNIRLAQDISIHNLSPKWISLSPLTLPTPSGQHSNMCSCSEVCEALFQVNQGHQDLY